MRFRHPDRKNSLSIIESAKKTMDYTLTLHANENSSSTIVRNIYECFRMLGDALLSAKGMDAQNHLTPIKELIKIQIRSTRPIGLVESLRQMRHNVNYYGYMPSMAEVDDTISLAKACFYPAYEKIKKDIQSS